MYEFAENQCEIAAFVCAGRRGRRPLQGADKNLKLLDKPEFEEVSIPSDTRRCNDYHLGW